MRIAVMGSGGIGGYFGGRLAATGRHDVWFVARGAHLEAIRSNGLQIKSALGDAVIRPARVTDDPGDIGPVDVIIFAVKLYDVATAAALCRPCVGKNTAVISLQNGIDSEALIDDILGAGHGVGGIAYAPVYIEAPGVVRHMGDFAKLVFGEIQGPVSTRLMKFAEACKDAGFAAEVSDSIDADLWDKFIFLASFAGVTCLARQPCRIIQEDEAVRQTYMAALAEAAAVARAAGIAIDVDCEARLLKMVMGMAPDGQSSMLTDLQNGKPLENAWFSGKIVRLGADLKVPTPVHQTLYAAMRPYENGAS